VHDKEAGTQREMIRRFTQLEFYKPGEYNVTFIRAAASKVPELAKLRGGSSGGASQQSYTKESGVIDDRYVLPVKIAPVEGKMTAS
jgi:hypothetical protein